MVGRWVGGVRVRQTAAGGGRGQEGGEDRRGEGTGGGGKQLQDGGSLGAVTRRT